MKGLDMFPKGYKQPPDAEKTEEDWAIYERLSVFSQEAFHKHWIACQRYLDARYGGKQTSRDLHMLCQGYALALKESKNG